MSTKIKRSYTDISFLRKGEGHLWFPSPSRALPIPPPGRFRRTASLHVPPLRGAPHKGLQSGCGVPGFRGGGFLFCVPPPLPLVTTRSVFGAGGLPALPRPPITRRAPFLNYRHYNTPLDGSQAAASPAFTRSFWQSPCRYNNASGYPDRCFPAPQGISPRTGSDLPRAHSRPYGKKCCFHQLSG